MEETPDKSNFIKLTTKEKRSKLNQLVNLNKEVVIWEKGHKNFVKYSPIEFNYDSMELKIQSIELTHNSGEVLYNFKINGLYFFGKAEFFKKDGGVHILKCKLDLFKNERRLNFRVIAYPKHHVYVQFNVKSFQSSNNVLDFRTGQSQTKLFQNFLALMGENIDCDFKEGFIPLRVMDISISGMSVHVGDLEKDFFEQGKKMGKFFINFNNEEIEIPDAEVMYAKKTFSKFRNLEIIKVGLKFIGIDPRMDQKLGELIFDAVRDFTSEIESYLD